MLGLPIHTEPLVDEEYQEISLISEKPIPSQSARIIRALTMPFRSSQVQERIISTSTSPRQRPSIDTTFLNLPSQFHTTSSRSNPPGAGEGMAASRAWLRTLATIRERKELEGEEGLLDDEIGIVRDIEGKREERRRRLKLMGEIGALFALSLSLIILVVLCSSGAIVRGRAKARWVVYPPRERGGMGHRL